MQAAMRLLSLVLIVLGLMLLGADVIASLEKGGEITVRSLDQVWMIMHPPSDLAFRAWLEHTIPQPGAQWIETVMGFWSWAVIGLPGVILAFLFGRRSGED
ncbi:MAG TPA: hypothetical protein VLT91_14355 [Rhizomicrobium sp.]|nr:hypothetical protein [Rhizomicrobium sp.]